MRKYQQKQILELIKTLFEVNAEIKRLFSRKDYSSVVGLLAESQEFVVQVGTFIEEISGEGTQTVALLEDFHDELYQASLEVGGENPGNSFIKHLRMRLTDIENSVKTELTPDRIEVVFFPYKPSMWDSLESVWQAAEDDPDCDAYVVPIPYYEKINLTNLGNMIYEGDQYPDYVPITDWRDYDVEKRNPDVIFIHYAYDDKTQNYSVHPNFFAKRMKEFCELLVYIPYYVQSGAEVPEYNGFLPGIVYSDVVIVQNEEVRQGYIEQYSKYYNQYKHVEKLKKPEDKFVALGSPKFDKILNSEREDYELPEDWKRLINNPDGTSKKVVLYNTHMFRWIDGGEQYFKKVQYVFDTFRTRDDVVLWWRPHPSTEQNFRTLRPQLLEEYYRTVEDYKSAGFGIYDDTADLHRAIACTDAYYGDGGSLPVLYTMTGKPIVYQNINALTGGIRNEYRLTNHNNLRFGDFVNDGNGSVWAFELFHDALFKLDFENDEAVFISRSGTIPQYLGKKGFTHRFISLHTYKDKLICFPSLQDRILVYYSSKKAHRTVKIDTQLLQPSDSDGFSIRYVIKQDSKFYCFSMYSNSLIVFDAETETLEYHSRLYDGLTKLAPENERIRVPIYLSEIETDGCAVFLPYGFGGLVKYSPSEQTFDVILRNHIIEDCVLADCSGEIMWLYKQSETSLIRWNLSDNTATKFAIRIAGFIAGEPSSFSGLVDCGNYLILFPSFSNMLIRFDKITEEVSEYKGLPMPEEANSTTYKYDKPKKVGNRVFAFARFNATTYELDTTSGSVFPHQFTARFEKTDDWLRFISEVPVKPKSIEEDAGKKIYSSIKRLFVK